MYAGVLRLQGAVNTGSRFAEQVGIPRVDLENWWHQGDPTEHAEVQLNIGGLGRGRGQASEGKGSPDKCCPEQWRIKDGTEELIVGTTRQSGDRKQTQCRRCSNSWGSWRPILSWRSENQKSSKQTVSCYADTSHDREWEPGQRRHHHGWVWHDGAAWGRQLPGPFADHTLDLHEQGWRQECDNVPTRDCNTRKPISTRTQQAEFKRELGQYFIVKQLENPWSGTKGDVYW